MRIELRAIVGRMDGGHKVTELVVTEDRGDRYKKHVMGVDVVVNRGAIITFLGGVYSMPPGQIVWPGHIEVA